MGQIENIKNRVRSIPEFSEKNYNIVGYVFAALITIAGLFLIYEVVTTDALVFKANWNMFKSPLGNLCWFIGFFWAIAWWVSSPTGRQLRLRRPMTNMAT